MSTDEKIILNTFLSDLLQFEFTSDLEWKLMLQSQIRKTYKEVFNCADNKAILILHYLRQEPFKHPKLDILEVKLGQRIIPKLNNNEVGCQILDYINFILSILSGFIALFVWLLFVFFSNSWDWSSLALLMLFFCRF
ncbi:unnamed protein product [Blepharisma stoltei]|uniref:Uncharacterized protein n=1 Tax=Blepharisma stoltei TaxID=1481888 RepID=A0AAU9IV72_9CILI|nr:unnamed protein product [Blepharisma stoltei]